MDDGSRSTKPAMTGRPPPAKKMNTTAKPRTGAAGALVPWEKPRRIWQSQVLDLDVPVRAHMGLEWARLLHHHRRPLYHRQEGPGRTPLPLPRSQAEGRLRRRRVTRTLPGETSGSGGRRGGWPHAPLRGSAPPHEGWVTRSGGVSCGEGWVTYQVK
jgi:hypothetical protein